MNTKPVILLLGATGHIGTLIAQRLSKNHEITLRVTSRKKEQLQEMRERYDNAVYLDLDDPRTFADALKDVNRLFLLTGYSVTMLAQSKTMIDAAKKAGVEHIVHLGVFSREWDCTDPHFLWHQMIDTYIEHHQFKWTFLHPNCFFQNLTDFSLVKNGKFRWYTSRPCGWIALEDVADAAAQILADGPLKHHGKHYWFSTELLSIEDITKTLTEVTGKQFIADLQPAQQFLTDQGADTKTLDPYFYSVAESFNQIEDGRMSYIGSVLDDIQTLFGHKGMSLHQWAQLHKQELSLLANEEDNRNIEWGG